MSEYEEEQYEEISNEEKLQIAQYYLMSSPPGEFQEIYQDLKKLVPEDVLTSSVLNSIARNYNIKTNKIVQDPQGSLLVLSSESELDSTNSYYLNPKTNNVFQLNPITLTTTSIEDTPSISSPSSYQLTLQSLADQYLSEYYLSKSSAATVYTKSNDNNTLHLLLSGEKINLKNFWTGKWCSNWEIQILNENTINIQGDIKIHVHYFEDGNLQMENNKKIPSNTVHSLNEVIEFIKNKEIELQTILEEVYVNMNTETFRSMRRTMAVTRNKMDWNLNSVRMIKQVRK